MCQGFTIPGAHCNDIVGSLMSVRKRFINEMERLAGFKFYILPALKDEDS